MASNAENVSIWWRHDDKFENNLLSWCYVDDFYTNICGQTISRDKSLKMLGITLDDKSNFNEHIPVWYVSKCISSDKWTESYL